MQLPIINTTSLTLYQSNTYLFEFRITHARRVPAYNRSGMGLVCGGWGHLKHIPDRKTSRPWAADQYLNEVHLSLMAFLRMLEYSDNFKERLQDLMTRIRECPVPDSVGKIKSIRSAKHRMESCQTPIGRSAT